MGQRHGILTHAFRTARTREQRGGCPTADCPTCGRLGCKVYWPTGGDGSVRVTFWHKAAGGDKPGVWCRAEVEDWTG